MKAFALTVGTLWDGRIQVWVQVANGFQSKHKASTEPGAPWTEWKDYPMPSGFQVSNLPCAFPVAGGNLNVFCNAQQIYKADNPDSLVAKGPSTIMFKTEYNPGGTSDWAPWWGTPPGSVLLGGWTEGGQLNIPPIGYAGGYPSQALWAKTDKGIVYVSKSIGDGSMGPFVKFMPPPPTSLLWTLYSSNNSDQNTMAVGGEAFWWTGTDINETPGEGQPYLTLYWFTESGWKEFSPALPKATGGVASLAAGVIADSPAQVFASDVNGDLWTIWQKYDQTKMSWFWLPEWLSFPLPGGHKLPSLAPGSLDFALPSLARNVLAAAQTVTGELQLFALDENGTVWTIWKKSAEPGASWSEWVTF